MNFLAHCALAELATEASGHGLIAGGILGDLWKGPLPAHWETETLLGVRLHRRIDAVSNRHPAIRRSCERFPPNLRRLAPVLVDIHADIALVAHWRDWFDIDVDAFAARCYQSLEQALPGSPGLSESALRFLEYLRREDLLSAYGTWDGVRLCLRGVGRRLGDPTFDTQALPACQALSAHLLDDFRAYFPDLLYEARRFVSDATSAPSGLHDEIGEQQIAHHR
ncbi:MAG: DUF479 domain-containing protein [Pseudomonadales bacterium]|nr:DUF479 domain-containing protein [Pseudomonadales bacterium]MCP5184134.1 DUF479 domain-containing protein [Pseudomonadales bacterium]